MTWVNPFIDELEKIAFALTPVQQRRQDLQLAGLGMTAAPIISGIGNMITHGRPIAPGTSPGRWLAGSAATGLLAGGLMPIVRRRIEQQNKTLARAERGG